MDACLYLLWKPFDINPNVDGARSEIVALKRKLWTIPLEYTQYVGSFYFKKQLLAWDSVAAQNFEFKISITLDKPL